MRSRLPPSRSLLAASLSFALAACGGRGDSPGTPKDTSPVVATVGEHPITTQALQTKLEEQPPFIRARYTSLEKKKELLDNEIRFELLLQEARRRGLDKDPEVLATLEKVMVQKLLRLHQEGAVGKVSDEELRQYYDAHHDEFVRPERVRVSHLFLAAPEGSAKRDETRATANKLLAEIKRQPPTEQPGAFEKAVRTWSADASTKNAGGDLGYKTREELTQAWGPLVAEVASGLKTVGELGTVVATDQGFHLLQLTGRQAGVTQPLDGVKTRIENRLLTERRSRSMDALIEELEQKTPVRIEEEVLGAMTISTSSAARTGTP
ncbi:hypothetical protein CYFUS_004319 [Cystobacter fuscus]|uniref:PpiC domain-containing protein n=1 Tax=Cystobacter fuscus TaxID=43 RepID=A0A250J5Z5_9BACT|nr:peptidyl-prolyl cis-trans isomerase [Cystobacter fuscus]ATB38882.1 hypothetical protein CYFUS_004319 [Cystobacter fuscus]